MLWSFVLATGYALRTEVCQKSGITEAAKEDTVKVLDVDAK
jgi:hypothetical protein